MAAPPVVGGRHGREYQPAPKPNPRGTTPAENARAQALAAQTTLHSPQGHPTVTGSEVGIQPINVLALQRQLIHAGYKIQPDGKMGPKTKSALADFLQPSNAHKLSAGLLAAMGKTPIVGNRDPKLWNQKFGTAGSRSVVSTAKVDASGNPVLGANNFNVPDPKGGTVDLGALAKLAAATGTPLDPSILSSGAQPIDLGLADQAAGAYDPAINNALNLIEQQPRDAAQNQHDISHWFGQVLGHQAQAATQDHSISQAGQDSIKQADASILGSLGGVANGAASSVAAQGADNLGTLAALGANQDQYNANTRVNLQDQQAGEASRQAALDSHNAMALATQLADAQSAKGAAKAQAVLDITGKNNDIADTNLKNQMALEQYNNGLKQQTFGNNLNLRAAQLAAMMDGLKVLGLGAPKQSAPKTINIKGAVQDIGGLLGVDSKGQIPAGHNPQSVAHVIGTYLQGKGIGPSDPRYPTLAGQIYSTFHGSAGQPLVPGAGWWGN